MTAIVVATVPSSVPSSHDVAATSALDPGGSASEAEIVIDSNEDVMVRLIQTSDSLVSLQCRGRVGEYARHPVATVPTAIVVPHIDQHRDGTALA